MEEKEEETAIGLQKETEKSTMLDKLMYNGLRFNKIRKKRGVYGLYS